MDNSTHNHNVVCWLANGNVSKYHFLESCKLCHRNVTRCPHLNLPFICPKMIIATIVTWCRCQIMSSHFPRKSAQQAGHQWSTKYYCDVAKGVVVMCHVSSRHSPRVHSATCDAAVCHVAGVRDVRPLLQVLRGADGVPAVLQGPGQGQPDLQGLPGGQ